MGVEQTRLPKRVFWLCRPIVRVSPFGICGHFEGHVVIGERDRRIPVRLKVDVARSDLLIVREANVDPDWSRVLVAAMVGHSVTEEREASLAHVGCIGAGRRCAAQVPREDRRIVADGQRELCCWLGDVDVRQ